MNFLRLREKNSEKNVLRFFSRVGSEESQKHTEKKVGLRQPDFLSFSGQIVSNVIFNLILKKIEKTLKFRNCFCSYWCCFAFLKRKRFIWCIYMS